MKERDFTRPTSAIGNSNGNGNGQPASFHFGAVEHEDVPHGRKGKHRTIVAKILEDLAKRGQQQAVRVPLSTLRGDKIQNLRSALNRASRLRSLSIATASDEKYLYVWNTDAGNSDGADS